MEQNLHIIAKKIWKIVRVIYFMLRKGMSKVNAMMKCGKLAGKEAIHNLIFHRAASGRCDYEFTCRDSHLGFNLVRRKHRSSPPNSEDSITAPSPALPRFAPSPVLVRQLRITDSPFPVTGLEGNVDHVDEAAEEFIMKFYKHLKLQD